MKKDIISFIIIAFFSSSCEDFLDEEMVSTITQDYFVSEKGLDELVVSTYNTLRWKYGYVLEGPFAFETGNDILESDNNNWATYNPSVWSASGSATAGGYISSLVSSGYSFINNINAAIELIENTAPGKYGTNITYANQRLSELYFNRAWTYYLLVTQLGDVPLSLQSNSTVPSNYYYPRSTSEVIYKKIIADLRFAYEHLPLPEETTRGRITKWAAAHFLAKLYLQRVQSKDFKTYRNTDGSIDTNNPNAYLGLLYKGEGANDLDSAHWFSTQVIDEYASKNGGIFKGLAVDYWDLFKVGKGDYSNEDNPEIILQASYGDNSYNGRYGMRTNAAYTCSYDNGDWNIPTLTWAYGVHKGESFFSTDWGYDVFTDKINDSRFEKSFQIEYQSASFDATSQTDGEGITYNDSKNNSLVWKSDDAAYFNTNILPNYDRPSWGNRNAVTGEHKIGRGDLGLVFLENTKETAIDKSEALAQPYVLYPRWVKDGNQYLYRKTGRDYLNSNTGLLLGRTVRPSSRKLIDPNRTTVDNHFGTRDVAIFRLAETFLIRAEVYGRQGDYAKAIDDINVVRARAAYKAGENRAEVLARLYPGSEQLSGSERSYPYSAASNTYDKIKVDASCWDGTSDKSTAENYPPEANTPEKRFIHFIYNEISREFNHEQILYEGIHHAGIQLERVLHHSQLGSSKQGNWPVSDNPVNGNGQDGNGKGVFTSKNTFKPFPQSYMDMLTDENGVLLSPEAKKQYQNPGY